MERRKFVVAGVATALSGAVAAVFPEFKAVAATLPSAKGGSWISEAIPSDQLLDVTSALSTQDVEQLVGFTPISVTAALGTLSDGTRIRRIGATQDEINTTVVLQHLQKTADSVLDTYVARWVGTVDDGIDLVSAGTSATTRRLHRSRRTRRARAGAHNVPAWTPDSSNAADHASGRVLLRSLAD